MATLYVENVPDDLYDALRRRAKRRRSSIAAEVIKALKVTVPTAAELKRRNEFYRKVLEYRSQASLSSGPFPSAEEMVREDRQR
jgi:plasmid stability protein